MTPKIGPGYAESGAGSGERFPNVGSDSSPLGRQETLWIRETFCDGTRSNQI